MDPGCTHEVEVLLRWADSAHIARGYECNLAFDGGYAQIVRWNGLGTSRAYTFRLTVAENCPCAIYSGRFTYEPCSRT